MSLNSYDNLKTTIANFMGRSDLGHMIPDFITLAEVALNNRPDFRVRSMVCKLIAEVDGSEIGLPTDYLGLRILRRSTGDEIVRVSPKALQAAKRGGCEGMVFSELGNRLEVYPPAHQDSMELYYYQRIPPLSDDTQTNWLLVEAPRVYLYGALLHAAAFAIADERVPLWKGAYDAAVQDVINADKANRWGSAIAVSLL